MNVWLLYGVAIDTPWDETLLRVCESEEAAREWGQLFLDTPEWASVFYPMLGNKWYARKVELTFL